MNKKNVKIVLSLFIIGLLTVSTQAISQNYYCYDNWTRKSDVSWWNTGIPSEYSLSESQVKKLNEIRIENNKTIVPLQNEMMVLKRNMQFYNTDSDLDVKNLKSDRKKVRELENKIADLNLDTELKIKKIFTKEQLIHFTNGGYGWWDISENCWYAGRRMADYNTRMVHRSRCCR